MSQINLLQNAVSPAAPSSGKVAIYAKTDQQLYIKDDLGTETQLTGGGGGGGDVATDAIWDAKGDLAGGTGANTAARLPVGTNGYVLTADSAEATGLKWAAVGGTGTVTSVNITAPAAGITASGGPVTASGSITLALADDLAAVEGLASTGIVRRTASNTWSAGTAVGLTTEVTGTLPVANGGTGATTLTGIVKGSGTGAFSAATAGTDYAAPGTSATWTTPQRGTTTTDNDLSFDLNVTNNFSCTPTAGGALTFTNIAAGQSGFIKLVNGSNYAITAAATTKVTTTFLATISATGTYIISYFSDGTNVHCATAGAMA